MVHWVGEDGYIPTVLQWYKNFRQVANILEEGVKVLPKRYANTFRKVNDKVKYMAVAANGHYAGFGPGTANSFRKMLGLKEASGRKWNRISWNDI